ncbi:hypothetical protein [Streptomyces showdoensis]|uniref:hypothetical protein n=1 Tax=Streptomyces showdoensis TaxID=68268 RepID=UPI0031ECCC98
MLFATVTAGRQPGTAPRNLASAARALNRGAASGTLLFDLLTEAEAADRAKCFDTAARVGGSAVEAIWLTG